MKVFWISLAAAAVGVCTFIAVYELVVIVGEKLGVQ